jgi:hypothetical protein
MSSPIENIIQCKYISNVGLFLACDESRIVNYQKTYVTHEYDRIHMRDGVVIAVKMEHIKGFLQKLHTIPCKFILATFDCDYTMPFDLLTAEEFYSVIEEPKLIHWYSVNALDCVHDKFSCIPLGINLHSIPFQHDMAWAWTSDRKTTPLDVEQVIEQVKQTSLPFHMRIPLCYSNFHFSMYDKFDNARQKAIQEIPSELMYYEPTLTKADMGWETQSKYTFVVSPHGNGLDCHRTWEALILGCIVIVKTSALDTLYSELPVLIVNSWSDITRELLDTTIHSFKVKTFNYDKLTVNYWKKKIHSGTI